MTLQSVFLPDELLLMIFSYLLLQDIKCLRLVSHEFHSCSSQFLLWSLNISSADRSLHFYKNISSDNLFRKGISKVIYNTQLRPASTGERDKLFPSGQYEELQHPAPDAFDQCYSVYDLLCYGIPRLPMLHEINITDRILQSPISSSTTPSLISTSIDERRTRNGELSLHPPACSLSSPLSTTNIQNLPPKLHNGNSFYTTTAHHPKRK